MSHQTEAALALAEKRHAEGYMQEHITSMLAGQGSIIWSEEETALLLRLIQDPAYRSRSPYHPHSHDAALVAQAINHVVHEGREVRTPKSIHNRLRSLKRVRT